MNEILSQDEVDSLLSGLSTGKVEAEADTSEQEPEEVSVYNFDAQDRVVRGRMPTLELINQRIAGGMKESLSNMLRVTLDISPESVNTLKFSEFGRSLPVPTSLHVYRMEPFRGHALLVLESRLVFNLLETFLGGTGAGQAKIEGREFTAIENVIIDKVVAECLKDIQRAWAPVEKIETHYVRSEVNPQFATIVLPTDLVMVSKFEVELDQSAGSITVCIPYAMIEPIRSKLSSGFQSDRLEKDYTWIKRVKEIILESSVTFGAQLGSTEISGERLMHLKVGDVIQLDQDAEKPLIACIENVEKFKGFAGVQRGFQAFRVQSKLHMEKGYG
ncbi:MAG: flagellar motor switch protein FliM [Desulfobacterales bacterium]|nr:flagellar motor switch protein FliM [Desulfobacterales bacterium]